LGDIYLSISYKTKGGLTTINLILVRHGLTRWNLEGLCQGFSDVELNQEGKKQIVELAKSLGNEKISAVYSSDLQRATDTAKEIAKYHNLTIKVDPDFREMNQGDFEGLTFEKIRRSYSELLSEWRENPETVRIPGGETLKEVQDRAWRGIQKLVGSHEGETVVTVSHNFTIVTLLCRFNGIGLRNFHNFRVKAASKNVIHFRNGSFKVSVQNDITHLSADLLK